MNARAIALALIGTGAMLVGCGGSSNSASTANTGADQSGQATSSSAGSSSRGSSGGKALSRARLIASADAICQTLNEQLKAAKDQATDPAAVGRVASRRAGEERAVVVALDRLIPPPSMAGDWQRIIGYRTAIVDDLVRIGKEAAASNSGGVQAAMLAGAHVTRQLAATAQHAGFKACSEIE